MSVILVWALITVGASNVPPVISFYSDKESCEAVRATIDELKGWGKPTPQKCVPVKVPSNRLT